MLDMWGQASQDISHCIVPGEFELGLLLIKFLLKAAESQVDLIVKSNVRVIVWGVALIVARMID